MQPTSLRYDAPFSEHISRLFVFRFLWGFVQIWIFWVWSVWIMLVCLVHVLHMLILGRRNKDLWSREMRYLRHVRTWEAYFWAVTDKRPDMIGR